LFQTRDSESEENPSVPADGRKRVVIEGVTPEIDHGRFPIKRVVADELVVEADIFSDSQYEIRAVLMWRHQDSHAWSEREMQSLSNDRWCASFSVSELGAYFYTIQAWVDRFKTWRSDLDKKFKAGQNVSIELLTGATLVSHASQTAPSGSEPELEAAAGALRDQSSPATARITVAHSPKIAALMEAHAPRPHVTTYDRELRVIVDPVRARFSSWYEVFPRSINNPQGPHGTFTGCEALLPRIAQMGFDILYLPPIHPIGRSRRRGKNNSTEAAPSDPGSPWAIGAAEGGHKSTHSELGNLEAFRKLFRSARLLNIEIALDIAFQCSPDHPYVHEHPEWFRKRIDGSIQFAENPPKKYDDIYPFDFETEEWRALWIELKSIFEFWIGEGVRIFRVDNPHTKPFCFWQWCLNELKHAYPDLIFLSEAFTRPKVMYYLAKIGFTQSYNYFPWRNTKWELEQYFTELNRSPLREYFRPVLWPNTPDILTQYLQFGGRPAFMIRAILAATLGASYGIYGPAFELCENAPLEQGSEEYLHSEKYEIRRWDENAPGNLTGLLTRVNQIRRENIALQCDTTLRFHATDNESLLAYSKHAGAGDNILLMVVNLDPYHLQRGWVQIDTALWGLDPRDNFQLHDLLTDTRYFRNGQRLYVELNPHLMPAHIFALRRYLRTEHDFDYYM